MAINRLTFHLPGFIPLLLALSLSLAVSGQVSAAETPVRELYLRAIVAAAGTALESQSDDGRYTPSPSARNKPQDRVNQYDQMLIYPVAYLYRTKLPLNPYYGDKRLLESVTACGDMQVKYESENVYPLIDWSLYSWLEAYDLVKDELGDRRRQAWAARMTYWTEYYVRYIEKSRGKRQYTAVQLGTSPNHYSLYMTTVLRAGQVLGRPEWVELVKSEFKNILRSQHPDGYWAEHDGPANEYNRVTTHGVGLYYALTHDPEALECLRRATDFNLAFTYPDGSGVAVIDERNRYRHSINADWGLLGQSHFPHGRRYNRLMVGMLLDRMGVASSGEVSRIAGGSVNGLSMAWTTDNLRYSADGPEEPAPQEMRNFDFRLVSGARLLKRGDWVVCLSGIISPPWEGNQYFLDRYTYLEIWHRKIGLVIGGGNTKRQPQIAGLLMEPSNAALDFRPQQSRITFDGPDPRLEVEFGSFRGRLKVSIIDDSTVKISAGFGEKALPALWPNRYECNLQVQTRRGDTISTAGGVQVVLDENTGRLLEEKVAGGIETGAWSLEVPDGTTSFRYPFLPFNNYERDGKTDIQGSVGILSTFTTDPQKTLEYVLRIK